MTASETYRQFDGQWGENARLAWDAIEGKATRGIPSWLLNVMEWSALEALAGAPAGRYPAHPVAVYLAFQQRIGTSIVDQWIPENPLSIRSHGYEEPAARGATTGAARIERDGLVIDSPEAAVEHMERFLFPQLAAQCRDFDAAADDRVARLIEKEVRVQQLFGASMLKAPYDGFQSFPGFLYYAYGYENYFMAYGLYPDVMERCFRLQGELGEKISRVAARAIREGGLPPMVRLDHDMADSRGTLVDVKSLDRIWFPHFARAIRPLLDAGVKLIWHCDGNLMAMVPRLLDVGLAGFQGFQYEDGMDYEKICRMKTREGREQLIIAGVSVTRTLPHGTPDDVRRELQWLVEHGPRTGLLLAASSSIAPGTPLENIRALVEGLAYYRAYGRGSA